MIIMAVKVAARASDYGFKIFFGMLLGVLVKLSI